MPERQTASASSPGAPPGVGEPPRILVVDDDPTFRRLFQVLLEKEGFPVIAVEGATRAQILASAAGAFDCAVVDYLMPGIDGIELIRWLHETDPALAALLVTAHGDKDTVERAWAAGACGFLDKPPTAADLIRDVKHAVKRSRENRRTARLTEDVNLVAHTQRNMIYNGVYNGTYGTLSDAASPHGASAGRGYARGPADGREDGWHRRVSERTGISIAHHPFHQAGGDFLVRFTASNTETLVLAADVSGHDLNAAFLAAHFQGLVRGMLRRSARIEEILEFCNHILLEEWNTRGAAHGPIPASIAVTALWIDQRELTLTVAVNGNPLPILTDVEGNSAALAEASCPLGWFAGPATHPAVYRWTPGSSVRLWTDGVEDLAERLQVDPLAVVCALHRPWFSGNRPPWLDLAADDVMAATVDLMNPSETPSGFAPIVAQTYGRPERNRIDEWQEMWRRSVAFAVGDPSEESMFNVLLVAREAVLNALQHGCRKDESAHFQAAYAPARQILRLTIRDPGPGHDGFTPPGTAAQKARGRHRGLSLIGSLARRVQPLRGGAELRIDMEMKFDGVTAERDGPT